MEGKRRLTGEERREQILSAALDLFAERGYSASTTRELAARAEISEAIIYRHFRSKEEVLQEVFRHYSFLPSLREFASLQSGGDVGELLQELGMRWLAFMRRRHPVFCLVLTEMHHDPRIRRIFRSTLAEGWGLATDALRARVDPARVQVDRLDTAVRMYFSSLLGQMMVEGPDFIADEERIERYLRQSAAVLADGVRQAEPVNRSEEPCS